MPMQTPWKVGLCGSNNAGSRVVKASTRGTEPYAFVDRVMFRSRMRGRVVVAFGGREVARTHAPAIPLDFTPPKYINSADTPFFHKGRTHYQASMRGSPQDHKILVVEGYMDVIACHQAGFKGAVAPLGNGFDRRANYDLVENDPMSIKSLFCALMATKQAIVLAVRAADRIIPLLKPSHSGSALLFLPRRR